MEYSQKDIDLFVNYFQGREDVFAKQNKLGDSYFPVRPERPLNEEAVKSHLNGENTYGIYPVMKNNHVKLLCFDIEIPKKFAELSEDYPKTKKYCYRKLKTSVLH